MAATKTIRVDCPCRIVLHPFPWPHGSKRLDSISDYSRHGFNLRVVCQGCGRAAVLDSLALSMARSKAGKVRMNIELWVRDVMLLLLTEIAVREFELRPARLVG